MNKSLLGFPKGRSLAAMDFGYPLGVSEDQIPRFPPVLDYDAWWDASDFSTLTIVSDELSQWNDKSSNGFNLTQATAASRPGYGASRLRKINGFTVPDFDDGDWMETTLDIDTTFTLFAVCACDVVSTTIDVVLGCMPSVTGLEMSFMSNTYRLGRSGIGSTAMDGIIPQDGLPVAYGIAYDGATVKFAVNKTRDSKAVVYTSTSTSMRMGNNGDNQILDGMIGEALVYKRYLSDSEITAIQNYLMNKWGL